MREREMYKMPETVYRLVSAVCADYNRREKELRSAGLSPYVRDKYRSINAVIDDAVGSVVSDNWASKMLADIVEEQNYANSKCRVIISRSGFRRWKMDIYLHIATALGFLDPNCIEGERHCAVCGTLIREAEFGSVTICKNGRRSFTLDLCPECASQVDGIEIDGTIGIVKQSMK